ncbi:MAG TPA: hypothetical protein VJN94_11385 [Candidatus Binataceae bacterium]|nr:hypothetical protein [Candidatus Binataceae bacterium]
MPKPKGKATKTKRQAHQGRVSRLLQIWRVARWILAALLTLFGIGATALAYFAYYPRVFVDPPSTSADPAHPFSEPFILTNVGVIPIYFVRVDCGPPIGVGFASTTGPQEAEPGEHLHFRWLMKLNVFLAQKLASQERHPFWCSGITPDSMVSSFGRSFIVDQAGIQINVHFRLLPFFPKALTNTNNFPFLGILEPDGAIHWSQTPLAEMPPPK